MSELLLRYAAWKEDVLGALWPHWSTKITPQNHEQSLELVLNSWFNPL